MGKRTGVEPDGTQTLLVRLCHALDVTPRELASSIGLRYAELQPLLKTQIGQLDLVGDDTWWMISDHISRQVGLLLAAKQDLDAALEKDRARRALRTAQLKAGYGRSSPR